MRRLVSILGLCLCGFARAVIVQGDDGIDHAASAGAGAGWNYVGRINGGAGGVYLGEYNGSAWVLTAGHVGAGSFTINDLTYGAVPDSAVTLVNDNGSPADLTLFRIDGDPGLANLTLVAQTPVMGAPLTMIGYGVGRDASETYWDSSWAETQEPSAYKGYKWTAASVERWGINTVFATTTVIYSNGVTTDGFYTRFRALAGSAQATSGDSGGGVFTSSGALAGIMIAVNDFGQPANTSIFGGNPRSVTYIADVSAYRTQIFDIIAAAAVPEPGGWMLAALGLGMLAARARKAPAAPR